MTNEPLKDPSDDAGRSLVTSLRWLLVLPVALLAAWATWVVLTFINRVTFMMTGLDPDGFLARIYIEYVAGLFMGAALVWAGAKTAPSHRKTAVFILTGIAIALAGFLLYPAIEAKNWWAVLSAACVGLGAGGLALIVHKNGLDAANL